MNIALFISAAVALAASVAEGDIAICSKNCESEIARCFWTFYASDKERLCRESLKTMYKCHDEVLTSDLCTKDPEFAFYNRDMNEFYSVQTRFCQDMGMPVDIPVCQKSCKQQMANCYFSMYTADIEKNCMEVIPNMHTCHTNAMDSDICRNEPDYDNMQKDLVEFYRVEVAFCKSKGHELLQGSFGFAK
jgi:hypothetical protein